MLIVQDETSRQRYLDVLVHSGARVFVASSFTHLTEAIGDQTFHGLFLDLLTKMVAIKENKSEVYHLTERFPVAHLKIDHRTGEIRCFYVGRPARGSIRDFVDKCNTTIPKKIRISARIKLNLPVLVYRSTESKHPERAVTKDISLHGCFIISARHRKEGEEIILRFPDLANTIFIKAQVRNVVKWGEGRQLPGFGVKFQNPLPPQVITSLQGDQSVAHLIPSI